MAHDHRDFMAELALRHGWTKGAELGLASGIMLNRMLGHCPELHMTGVDLFRKPERKAKCMVVAARFPGRVRVIEGSTHDAADQVEDASLDFVFIDAGHGYEAVRDDIARWEPKVREGGALMGHDYDPQRHPGVVAAVQEAFGLSGFTLLPYTVWSRR